MADIEQFHAIGRRKSASARVYLRPGGTGQMMVNDLPVDEYFDRRTVQAHAKKPLEFVDKETEFDIICNAAGGGKSGQSGAIQLGVARALVLFDPELRKSLKDEGFLTRDDRVKERKKYGRRGARAGMQFSKR